MRDILWRFAAITMAALMLLTVLAGCRGDDGSVEELSEYVYVPQIVPLPRSVDFVEHLTYCDGKVYFAATSISRKYDMSLYQADISVDIYSVNIDGTELAKLSNYTPPADKPDGADGACYIRGMSADSEGNLWVVENWSFNKYDFPEDYDPEMLDGYDLWQNRTDIEAGTMMRKLDASGAELLSVDLSGYPNMKDEFNCRGFTAGKDSATGEAIIYLGNSDRSGDTEIYALGGTGSMLFNFKVSREQYADNRFIQLPNGRVAFPAAPGSYPASSGNSGYALQTIDATAGALGETVALPSFDSGFPASGASNGYSYPPSGVRMHTANGRIFTGNGDYDICFDSIDGVYACNIGDKEAALLLDWQESNIVTRNAYNPMIELVAVPGGHVMCVYEAFNRGTGRTVMELLVLKKTLRSELTEKTALTLATMGVSENLSYAVMDFNRVNSDYFIEIVDYLSSDTQGAYEAALTRLATDITAGKIPDIMCIDRTLYGDYARAGLFADLYPFIDADPDFERSDFVQAAFRASEVDGGLYAVFSAFSVGTMVGEPSIVGAAPGWNMEEFAAVLEGLDRADLSGSSLTKLRLLERELMFSIGGYINMETGAVSFDTPEFIRLLELTGALPFAVDWDDLDFSGFSMGAQIMGTMPLASFSSLQEQKAWFGGRDVVIKGWPTENRNGHALQLASSEVYSIADNSAHKDAAWAFVRTFLDKDWQLDMQGTIFSGFPTNQAAFDEMARKAPGKDPRLMINDIWVETPTQEDVDLIIALIDTASEAANRSINIEEGLWDIISESASDYYYGMTDAEDAARVIQSRVSIWVAERS